MLRIVQASPFFDPHVGGVESHVGSIARELAARGHEVTVLTASQGDAPAVEERDGLRIERLRLSATPAGTPILRGLAARVRA
ncbi:MAG TPA: glycosyltransferase, partial [Candidatus Thermoplasmatota archaeon]|nr:glycosyltransferase [Candidatus Thermoplasmatota archaeon]